MLRLSHLATPDMISLQRPNQVPQPTALLRRVSMSILGAEGMIEQRLNRRGEERALRSREKKSNRGFKGHGII
jgi:hypothetical protein